MIPQKNLRLDGKVRRQSGTWMKGSNQVLPGYPIGRDDAILVMESCVYEQIIFNRSIL